MSTPTTTSGTTLADVVSADLDNCLNTSRDQLDAAGVVIQRTKMAQGVPPLTDDDRKRIAAGFSPQKELSLSGTYATALESCPELQQRCQARGVTPELLRSFATRDQLLLTTGTIADDIGSDVATVIEGVGSTVVEVYGQTVAAANSLLTSGQLAPDKARDLQAAAQGPVGVYEEIKATQSQKISDGLRRGRKARDEIAAAHAQVADKARATKERAAHLRKARALLDGDADAEATLAAPAPAPAGRRRSRR